MHAPLLHAIDPGLHVLLRQLLVGLEEPGESELPVLVSGGTMEGEQVDPVDRREGRQELGRSVDAVVRGHSRNQGYSNSDSGRILNYMR